MKIPVIGTAVNAVKANPAKAGKIGAFAALTGLAIVGVNTVLKNDMFAKSSSSEAHGEGAAHEGDIFAPTGSHESSGAEHEAAASH